jgi:hypothetical protein
MRLICPNLRCRKVLTVPEEVRGRIVKCQHCQTMLRVPKPANPTPAPTEANADVAVVD